MIVVLNYKYNKLGKQAGYNIMRGYSALANPYKVKPWGPYERGETLDLYKDWLYNKYYQEKDSEIIREINLLLNKYIKEKEIKLVCACTPAPCHGDVISKLIYELCITHLQ